MKIFISIVMLLALAGSVMADTNPSRRLTRPLVIFPQESVSKPGLIWQYARVLLGLSAAASGPYRIVAPPAPSPVCDLFCQLRPVQGVKE